MLLVVLIYCFGGKVMVTVVGIEEIAEVPAVVMIMATGGLLDAHPTEVGVITLLPDSHLMVEDQEGKGPGHILLDPVLRGTMVGVLGEI